MKVSELSRRSGVAIPTIKYYIREGLLAPGERTARNQAAYGEDHLARLELIRSLREVGGLPVATIRQVLLALEEGTGADGSVPALALALRALGSPVAGGAPLPGEGPDGEALRDAGERVDGLVGALGWEVPADAQPRLELARALVAIDRHWPGGASVPPLEAYGRIAEQLAELEIPDDWDPAGGPGEALRYAVLGTVLFEAVVLSLRRLAHIDRSRRLAVTSPRARSPRRRTARRSPPR